MTLVERIKKKASEFGYSIKRLEELANLKANFAFDLIFPLLLFFKPFNSLITKFGVVNL